MSTQGNTTKTTDYAAHFCEVEGSKDFGFTPGCTCGWRGKKVTHWGVAVDKTHNHFRRVLR